MKKILLTAVIVFLLIATSCRKERSCECKVHRTEAVSGFNPQTNLYSVTSTTTMARQKKNEFKYRVDCFSKTYTTTDAGGSAPYTWTSVNTIVQECKLK